MNTQTQHNIDKEHQLTLELLQAIDQQDDISQRHLAEKMGVALGLANSYLKRCVKKGLIKMKTAPANRYLYYLTPHGFSEKARLTAEFLTTSLTLFRQSGEDYAQVFAKCATRSQLKIVLGGISDLTEIAYMRSLQSEIEVVAVYQPEAGKQQFFGLPVVSRVDELPEHDAVVMTSMEQTQALLTRLSDKLSEERITVPSLLLNMNYRSDAA